MAALITQSKIIGTPQWRKSCLKCMKSKHISNLGTKNWSYFFKINNPTCTQKWVNLSVFSLKNYNFRLMMSSLTIKKNQEDIVTERAIDQSQILIMFPSKKNQNKNNPKFNKRLNNLKSHKSQKKPRKRRRSINKSVGQKVTFFRIRLKCKEHAIWWFHQVLVHQIFLQLRCKRKINIFNRIIQRWLTYQSPGCLQC